LIEDNAGKVVPDRLVAEKSRLALRLPRLTEFAFQPLPECEVSVELFVIQPEEIPRWITDRPRLVATTAFQRLDIIEKRPFEQETLPAAHKHRYYRAFVIDLEDKFLVVTHDLT
jgi:hypothetical protein